MNRQQLHSSSIRCFFMRGEWGWTLNMMLLEATEKRKRRIIAKHVAMRLSFTITTTNFWRPDMNDCGLGMRSSFAISPTFPTLALALVALQVRYHPPHIFHSTAGKNLSRKISRSRRPFFPLASTTALSVRRHSFIIGPTFIRST